MTTMCARPYENLNNAKYSSHNNKSRRNTYQGTGSPLSQKKGSYNLQNCTIDKYFQQKFANATHFKSQEQLSVDYHTNNRKFSHSAVESDNYYNDSYNPCKYNRKYSAKSPSAYEKSAWNSPASTASDSDGNSSHTSSSELSGFRIVQEGKVLHNEIEEEVEFASDEKNSLKLEDNYEKFAASVMVTGPNVNKISIPTFV